MQYLIPEQIETERLVLRTFKEQDWKAMHAIYSDEECTRYTIGRTLSEGESWRTTAALVGHWQLRGYGPYALEESTSGQVVGTAGLWYPCDWPEPEIKWALSRRYWGKGYAGEAARAVKKMAGEYLPEVSLISLVFSANENSKKLALSLGATPESEITFRGQPAIIFRHEKGNGEIADG